MSGNMKDMIKRPSHYTSHPSGVECRHIIEHFSANIAAAVKYCWRCGLKGGDFDRVIDLKKAIKFLEFEIERLEREDKGRPSSTHDQSEGALLGDQVIAWVKEYVDRHEVTGATVTIGSQVMPAKEWTVKIGNTVFHGPESSSDLIMSADCQPGVAPVPVPVADAATGSDANADNDADDWYSAMDAIKDTLEAYIHKSSRPDCLPSHRFRAVMPDGTPRWFPTHSDALDALIVATGPGRAVAAKAGDHGEPSPEPILPEDWLPGDRNIPSLSGLARRMRAARDKGNLVTGAHTDAFIDQFSPVTPVIPVAPTLSDHIEHAPAILRAMFPDDPRWIVKADEETPEPLRCPECQSKEIGPWNTSDEMWFCRNCGYEWDVPSMASVVAAREAKQCRVCGQPETEFMTYDRGREFAHAACVRPNTEEVNPTVVTPEPVVVVLPEPDSDGIYHFGNGYYVKASGFVRGKWLAYNKEGRTIMKNDETYYFDSPQDFDSPQAAARALMDRLKEAAK